MYKAPAIMKKHLVGLVFIAIVLQMDSARAQLVGGDSYLKGRYVEVGIASFGYFGSSGSAPTGYHPNPCCELGFVADPAMDGWTVGTPPYFGDYFLPCSPYEGFGIQANGLLGNSYNGTTPSAFLVGSNVSNVLVGSTYTAVWQGGMDTLSDSLQITQVVTLDTNNLYFKVDVTLTNLGVLPLNNIYYTRNLDPDNAVSEGSTFSTNNYIVGQVADTGFSLVTAVDPIYSAAYLGLGSTDTNSRVFIFNDWPMPYYITDLSVLFGSPSGYVFAQGDSVPDADIGIGIVFRIAHLSGVDSAADSTAGKITSGGLHPANSKTLSYFYSFSADASTAAIRGGADTTVTAVRNVNASVTIKAYPNPAQNAVYVSGLEPSDRTRIADMMGNTFDFPQTGFSGGTGAYSVAGLMTGHYLLIVTDAAGTVKARMPILKN